jgi:hypothetical protein
MNAKARGRATKFATTLTTRQIEGQDEILPSSFVSDYSAWTVNLVDQQICLG